MILDTGVAAIGRTNIDPILFFLQPDCPVFTKAAPACLKVTATGSIVNQFLSQFKTITDFITDNV
jgi:hypothetical protein